MKKVTLHKTHEKLGAKMVSFAGFEMPIQYKGVSIEHQTVRESIGVFDVSHMGEFLVEGENALELLQRVTSNDVASLEVGAAQYSCFPNQKGGIVDDLILYRIKETTYMLVVNAANIEKDWKWLSIQNSMNVPLRNVSDSYSLLAIQGPKTKEVLQSLTSIDLASINYYNFKIGDFAGIEHVILSATGYTGSGGFEIYCKNSEVNQIWERVFEAGAPYGIEPIGLAARDTLRLEMGYCLYGNDIDDTTSPLEAGLGWITKFSKNFTNSESLALEKKQGSHKKLVGFELIDRGVPRKGYEICNEHGEVIGNVTSGTMGPSVKKGIGMGYVPSISAKVGTDIFIRVRKKMLKAKVVKLPFYKNNKL
ncbi:MAG: glycine cleavage system aminomethyltransferase GcvT [Flavicella sp.]